jgi:thiol-disulfide isomerase/thioredoxin
MVRKKASQRKRTRPSRLPQFLILGGVILLALVVVALKSQPDDRSGPALVNEGELPERQLERALQAGQPTLAFFHSNNCEQCLIMMETVGQVYPEFASSVTLVDVDVYDKRNDGLLRQSRIQVIPTLIFFNRQSQGQVHYGVMEAGDLRRQLAGLSEGN